MKNRLSAVLMTAALLLAVLLILPLSALGGKDVYTDVAVLSTTDMHGKCWHTDVLTDTPERNSMLSVSTAVARFREKYGREQVILLDNGDIFQGTPVSESSLLAYSGEREGDPPAMAVCLKEIGYDAFELGNHEFNFDWKLMSGVYRYLEENGVPVLGANVVWDGSDGIHEAGANAFTPWISKTVTVNGHAHKIGILGLENTDITRWDLPDRYPGLRFSHPGNDSCSITAEATPYLSQMQEEGCEFIIVLYHGGLGSADGELVFSENSANQGLRLIRDTAMIDLLILGHDHSNAYSNTRYLNAAGKEVLVVNGGGRQLTKTVLRFREDAAGALTWEILETGNVDLGNADPDPALETRIAPCAARALELVNAPLGAATGEWDGSSEYYIRQTDTIDLISAAMMEIPSQVLRTLYNDPAEAGIPGLDHLDVDMCMNTVLARNQYTVRPGPLTMRDTYRMYRFPNLAQILPMRGSQIRAVMEENAASRLSTRVMDGEVYYYNVNDNNTNIIFSGLNFTCDLARPEGNRVQIGGFANGRPFTEDGVYLVAVSNYLLGNDRCGLRSFSEDDVLWAQEDDQSVQDLIAAYVREHSAEAAGLTPSLFPWRWSLVYSGDRTFPHQDGQTAAARLVRQPEDGHTYVLRHEPEGRILTGTPTSDGLAGVDGPARGNDLLAPLPADALRLTVHAREDGSLTLVSESGLSLTLGTGGLRLTEEPEERLSRWILTPAYSGWNLIFAETADTEAPQAIQYYASRFTTYSHASNSSFILNFYEVDGDEGNQEEK